MADHPAAMTGMERHTEPVVQRPVLQDCDTRPSGRATVCGLAEAFIAWRADAELADIALDDVAREACPSACPVTSPRIWLARAPRGIVAAQMSVQMSYSG